MAQAKTFKCQLCSKATWTAHQAVVDGFLKTTCYECSDIKKAQNAAKLVNA